MGAREAMLADALEHATSATRDAASTNVLAVVDVLRAIHLALAAAALPPGPVEPGPGEWMHLELFGHSYAYGLVREVEQFGRRWLEVTEPEIVGDVYSHDAASSVGGKVYEDARFEERRKLYHPNAVYAMEASDEETVMGALRRGRGIRVGVGVPAHQELEGEPSW